MLDAAAGAGVLEGGERLGDRPVADGVDRDVEAARRGPGQQGAQLVGRLVGLALLDAGDGLLGVGLAAPGACGC